MEAERHAHMIEAEREKRESRREKLAVGREKVAADKEKAESDKQMLSQMVEIMHTHTVMLPQVQGRCGAAGSSAPQCTRRLLKLFLFINII